MYWIDFYSQINVKIEFQLPLDEYGDNNDYYIEPFSSKNKSNKKASDSNSDYQLDLFGNIAVNDLNKKNNSIYDVKDLTKDKNQHTLLDYGFKPIKNYYSDNMSENNQNKPSVKNMMQNIFKISLNDRKKDRNIIITPDKRILLSIRKCPKCGHVGENCS
jgi:hypothetical protein